MVGLALSMGATSLLVPRQGDSARAAESKIPEATPSSVSQAAFAAELDTELAAVSPSATETHVVREGQTLQKVAERYKVDVEALAAANGLTTSAVLKAGQVLKIPAGSVNTAKLDGARSPQLLALAELSSLPISSPVDTSSDNQVRDARDQALDRLQQERNKLRNSLAELRRGESNTVVASAEADTAKQPVKEQQNRVITEMPRSLPTVRSLPTENPAAPATVLPNPVASPALQDSLVASSPSADLDWMRVNQSLVVSPTPAGVPPLQQPELPEANSLTRSSQSAQRTATFPEVPVQTASSSLNASQELSYQVNPGDTVAQIARAHNIPQSTLISANGLSDPNVIFVGQVLRLPEVSQAQTERDTDRPTVPSVLPTSTVSKAATLGQVEQPSNVAPSAPAQANAAQPRTVAVVPSSIAPSSLTVPSLPLEDDSIAPSAVTGRNPYVQILLSEIKSMRERRTEQPTTIAAVTDTTEAVTSLGGAAPAEAPAPVRSTEPAANRLPQALRVAPRETTPTVVAAAPLGSENYAPLLEPITGRMVSPDLPSLPGAEHFLPDGVLKGFIWPARGVLTSGYGWRWGRMHRGIDIASDIGTPIHAAASGVVEYAGWNSGGYGNMVEIRHSDGSMTRYAHMNAIYVQQGQRVSQSEQIGEMGSTGYSTGPHLHFEVHLPDQGTVNPMAYLPAE
jgi:murein DD-endopeptidase MepM/ murein hydrolase activator NlpD